MKNAKYVGDTQLAIDAVSTFVMFLVVHWSCNPRVDTVYIIIAMPEVREEYTSDKITPDGDNIVQVPVIPWHTKDSPVSPTLEVRHPFAYKIVTL